MLRRSTYVFLTALLLGAGLLVGCGGTTTPVPPTGLTVSSSTAAWGSSVTLSGANLGSSGALELGGVAVTPSSWTPSKVVFDVPAGAPSGPQSLTITTAGGSKTVDLFVGVEFASGTLEDLEALALPPGTAVRLGAGTFSSSSTMVSLHDLSLYGRGEGVTTLDTGADPQYLHLVASSGFELTLADLTLKTDATLIAPVSPVLPAAAAGGWSLPASLEELLAAVAGAGGSATQLTAQAVAPTSYTLRNVTLESATPDAIGLLTVDLSGGASVPLVYGGDLVLDNVSAAGFGGATFLVGGSVEVRGSQISTPSFTAFSITSLASVRDSRLASTDGMAWLGDNGVVIGGMRGVTVTGSEISAPEGVVQLAGILPLGGFPLSSETVITDNMFFASEADHLDSVGEIDIMFGPGTALVSGNSFTASERVGFSSLAGAATILDNAFTVGSATHLATFVAAEAQGELAFRNNDVEFLSPGSVLLSGAGVRFVVTDNLVAGHANTGSALWVEQNRAEPLTIEASGNRFLDFGQALRLSKAEPWPDMYTARINDNSFEFAIDAMGKAAQVTNMYDGRADLDATRNRWGENVSAATVAGHVHHVTSDAGILRVDPITLP